MRRAEVCEQEFVLVCTYTREQLLVLPNFSRMIIDKSEEKRNKSCRKQTCRLEAAR